MITAVTITEPVTAWLQMEPRRLRVHSVFPQAINLVGDERQFLTLLAKDADDGPFALRLACPRLPDVPEVTAGCAAHGTIFLGPLVIDWRSATRWDPTLKPFEKAPGSPLPAPVCLHKSDSVLAHALLALSSPAPIGANLGGDRRSSSGFRNENQITYVFAPAELSNPAAYGLDLAIRAERNRQVIQSRSLSRGSRPSGLLGTRSLGLDLSAFHAQLITQAAGHLATLRAGLQGDDVALAGAVRSLLGFGEGLTPAGDDCLLGVLAARRMLGQPAGRLEATILASASRTTSLSAAFLRAACDGQFAGHWHRLRDALAHGEAAEIEEAARCILAHGATSGADALVGWVVGLVSRRARAPAFSDLQPSPSR